jgi:NadR type nicotinamide-nucleotide adenylyltransferase
MNKYKNSVIIGKFHGVHFGHIYMIETARALSEKVYVLVYTMKKETIPGILRYEAMKKHFQNDPIVEVKWIEKDIPQYPHEHPDFWNIWKKDITQNVDAKIDCIFGSEDYVKTLSEYIECKYYMVDIDRKIVPISGTDCRRIPLHEWNYIIPEMRIHFTKKICFVGGESTGKSTLARMLSKIYQTNYVDEFGREYCLTTPPSQLNTGDYSHIARMQLYKEKEALPNSNKILFCDTDAIITQCYHILYLGERSKDIDNIISKNNYDHYFLLTPTIEFECDGTREMENKRIEQFNLIKKELDDAGRTYTLIDTSDLHIRIRLIKEIIDNLWIF